MAEIVHITLPLQFIGIAQGGETDPRSKRREKRLCLQTYTPPRLVRTLRSAVHCSRSTMSKKRSRPEPQGWTGRAKRVGEWWTLHNGARSVTCDLYTHPLGGELRCELDGEPFALRPSWNLQELLGTSEQWKAWLEKMGWVAPKTASKG